MSTNRTTYWATKPSILKPFRDRIISLKEAADPELTDWDWFYAELLEQLEAEGYDLRAIGRFLMQQFAAFGCEGHTSSDHVEFRAFLEVHVEMPPLKVIGEQD